MKSIKMRGICAAVTGALLFGFGANAMADSTTDIVNALVAKGVLADNEAELILKGSKEQKEAEVKAAKHKEFDFINSDAPFKYETKLAGHDADIQVYGIIDIGGAHANHSLPANNELPNNLYPYSGAKNTGATGLATKPQTTWINGGLQDSRIGLKGGVSLFEAMDNKFKFIYQFEAGFNPLDMKLNNAAKTLAQNSGTGANSTLSADSSLNGEFFARQAWVGIDGGKLGKVSYGTQYNPFYEITGAYDPNGKADTFSPLGESGTIGGGGGVSENSRMKNSLKYANTFDAPMEGKVNIAGMYEFGNASGNVDHGYGVTGQVGYENAIFGVQFAYDKFTDALKAGTGTTLGTISAGLYNTDATMLAAKWTPTEDIKVSGGWEWYKLKPSSDASLSYGSLFNQAVYGGVVTSGFSAGQSQDNNVYWIGANYDFAKRVPMLAGLSTSVGYYATRFDAKQNADGSSAAGTKGDIDTWTFIADYKLNKRFDTYFAYTTNHFSSDKYATGYYTNVDTVGAGVRMKF
jgi:predicted porin